jgi:glycosyltransferase involved in cell wall biosynthesis
MTPRVSVVTTVYNGAPYFERAIPGIRAQTYEDFEVVVVDDGSTDGSLQRLQAVAASDRRFRVFAPGRLGAAAAYNYGVAQATGEYIARQDFDDCSYPERLRLQVAYLDAHPKVGVVGGAYLLVDERRGERYVRTPPADHASIVLAMARYVPIAHTMATFRRRAWSEAGGYPEVNNLIDLRFYLRVAARDWQFANLPDVLGEHYVHDSSWFHRSLRYTERQRDLASVQAQAVRQLGLPRWMYVFAAARYAYAYAPDVLKRMARRSVARSRERDV